MAFPSTNELLAEFVSDLDSIEKGRTHINEDPDRYAQLLMFFHDLRKKWKRRLSTRMVNSSSSTGKA